MLKRPLEESSSDEDDYDDYDDSPKENPFKHRKIEQVSVTVVAHDIVLHIASFLDPLTIAALSHVCVSWYHTIHQRQQDFWKKLYVQCFHPNTIPYLINDEQWMEDIDNEKWYKQTVIRYSMDEVLLVERRLKDMKMLPFDHQTLYQTYTKKKKLQKSDDAMARLYIKQQLVKSRDTHSKHWQYITQNRSSYFCKTFNDGKGSTLAEYQLCILQFFADPLVVEFDQDQTVVKGVDWSRLGRYIRVKTLLERVHFGVGSNRYIYAACDDKVDDNAEEWDTSWDDCTELMGWQPFYPDIDDFRRTTGITCLW